MNLPVCSAMNQAVSGRYVEWNWGVVGILRLVMSVTKKPWNSREFGNSRAAFAQHFLDTYSPESPEFQEILPDVASDLGLDPSTSAQELHEKCSSFRSLFTEQDVACQVYRKTQKKLKWYTHKDHKGKKTTNDMYCNVLSFCLIQSLQFCFVWLPRFSIVKHFESKVSLRRWFQWVFRWRSFAQSWHFMQLGNNNNTITCHSSVYTGIKIINSCLLSILSSH